MKSSYEMTDKDRAELAAIEQSVIDAAQNRIKFFAKLRQRAFRARKREQP